MNRELLKIELLTKVFSNGKKALDNVSLNINRGDFIVLAGRNGSGKTVLMRHLNGLEEPTSGTVFLKGKPIKDNLEETRRTIGMVFQNADAQIIGATVEKDTAFGPENLKLDRDIIKERVEAALRATGLEEFNKRRPHTLSGGEKRRLAIAGVLAMEPEIIVLDEPFTGMDWPGSSALLDILDNLHKSGTTIILITHDLEKVLAHADRLVVMEEGKITADGTPEECIKIVEKAGIRRPNVPVELMSWKTMRKVNE